jgi:hypothetical protein
MKIDFSKIQVKDIEGNEVTLDVSQELGNMMYLNARDIAVADLGHEIYHKKEVELNDDQAKAVAEFVENGFKAFVKREILAMLKPEQK